MTTDDNRQRPGATADPNYPAQSVRKLHQIMGILKATDMSAVRQLSPPVLSLLSGQVHFLREMIDEEKARRLAIDSEARRRDEKFDQEEKAQKELVERLDRQKRLEALQKFRGDTATVIP